MHSIKSDNVKSNLKINSDTRENKSIMNPMQLNLDLESKMNTIVERLDKFNADKEESKSKMNSIETFNSDLESKMNKIVERLDKFNADKEESNSKMNTILESLNNFNSYYDRKRLKKERKQNLKEEYKRRKYYHFNDLK